MSTVYLITGANRGIGRALLELFIARPSTTVVALVRDIEHSTAKSLSTIAARADDSKVLVLPYEATAPDSAAAAINTLEHTHGITHLDVVVANAGMLSYHGPSIDMTPETIQTHVAVNTIGPFTLFRACLPLLRRSRTQAPPKFIAISSAIGSTADIPKYASSATLPYGLSKAALNHVMRKLSLECADVVVEMLTPGPVLTDLMRDFMPEMKELARKNPKLLERFKPVHEVATGLVACIDGACLKGQGEGREGTSGGFREWTGEKVPF